MTRSSKLPLRRKSGFTLVEISVVVVIVGIIATVSVPQIKRIMIMTKSEALITDLRVLSQAFEHHLQEKGDWPPEEPVPGSYPKGMDGFLRQSNWSKTTPIGGYYNWDRRVMHNGQKIQAAIAVSSANTSLVTTDRLQLEDIDRRIDDGNLSTGKFRLGFKNEPILILEP